MINETTELIFFAAVCEHGSMSQASVALECSTAQVSRKITQLEKRLKTKLFHRTTRKLTLTDAGLSLKDDAVGFFKSAKKIRIKSKNLTTDLSGDFVITAPISLATFMLQPILPALQNQFPDITFTLIPSDTSFDLINEGVDLAIRTGSVVDDSLVAHQVGIAHDVFIANHDHLKAHGLPQSIQDLEKHKILINDHSMYQETVKLSFNSNSMDWRPNDYMKVNLYTIIIDLVYDNFGIGFAPNYCLPQVQNQMNISQVLNDYHGKQWPIFIVYPFSIPTPVKTAKVAAFIKRAFSEYNL